MSPALRVETITSEGDFAALEAEWNELSEACGLPHPFLTWTWVRSWWEAWGGGGVPLIFVVRRGRQAVAIAPLMLGTRRLCGIRARSIEIMGNDHTPRSGILVAVGASGVAEALWRELSSVRDRWDVLMLNQLPEDSTVGREFELLAGGQHRPSGVWRSSRSPFLMLAGSWDSYWAGLDAKLRSNVRNRLGRLGTIGAPRLEVIEEGPGLGSALEEGLVLEAAAWKQSCRTAILSQPSSRHFYRTLAERAARLGWLRLQFLTAGERRIAFQYGLEYRKRFFLLKPGYDPRYHHCSPGTLLCFMALRDAFEKGLEEFDFAGEADEWKMRWTDRVRPHSWLFVFPRGLRARLIHLAKFRLAPRVRGWRMARVVREAISREAREAAV